MKSQSIIAIPAIALFLASVILALAALFGQGTGIWALLSFGVSMALLLVTVLRNKPIAASRQSEVSAEAAPSPNP